jgi:hypothetical protein
MIIELYRLKSCFLNFYARSFAVSLKKQIQFNNPDLWTGYSL